MEKIVKNSGLSVMAQIVTMILQFVNRRAFVLFLDIEYLGYQSLFGNVLSLLSVAELGIVNVISFHLYKEFNEKNEEEIGKMMHLYKWMYRVVAVVVLIIGGICFCFLPIFVRDEVSDWNYLRLIYVLQLGAVVASYFLSYKRVIFLVDQKEYKCIQKDLYVSFIIQIIQLFALFIFRNYIIYLCINLSRTLISNFLIAKNASKDYPLLRRRYKVTKKDIKERNIIQDLKNLLIHKISVTIYNSTDNIVISAFCGIRMVALYGNYIALQNSVLKIALYSVLNPVQATIGTIVHGNRNKDNLWKQFETLDVFSFYYATLIALGFLIFYQPFMQIWMGKEYLLSNSFIILNSITIYFSVLWEIVYKYRSTFGEYRLDRNYMIISAILNLAISIPGAKLFGISGVQFGTLVAFMPIGIGRVTFVVKDFFHQSRIKYLLKHICLFVIVSIEGAICFYVGKNIPVNISGFFLRGILWLFVPLIVNTLVYFRNPYFNEMLKYLKGIVGIVKNKFINGKS